MEDMEFLKAMLARIDTNMKSNQEDLLARIETNREINQEERKTNYLLYFQGNTQQYIQNS
jgi:hypothetical protein